MSRCCLGEEVDVEDQGVVAIVKMVVVVDDDLLLLIFLLHRARARRCPTESLGEAAHPARDAGRQALSEVLNPR